MTLERIAMSQPVPSWAHKILSKHLSLDLKSWEVVVRNVSDRYFMNVIKTAQEIQNNCSADVTDQPVGIPSKNLYTFVGFFFFFFSTVFIELQQDIT